MVTSTHRSGLSRRYDGSTLLTMMVGVKGFVLCSSSEMFSVALATLKSLVVSLVPPTMNISSMVFVLAASSIICSISARVAPDFLRMLMWLPLDVLSTRTSRSRLFTTSSVTARDLPSLASPLDVCRRGSRTGNGTSWISGCRQHRGVVGRGGRRRGRRTGTTGRRRNGRLWPVPSPPRRPIGWTHVAHRGYP